MTLTIVKFAQVSVVIYQHHQVVKVIVGIQYCLGDRGSGVYFEKLSYSIAPPIFFSPSRDYSPAIRNLRISTKRRPYNGN